RQLPVTDSAAPQANHPEPEPKKPDAAPAVATGAAHPGAAAEPPVQPPAPIEPEQSRPVVEPPAPPPSRTPEPNEVRQSEPAPVQSAPIPPQPESEPDEPAAEVVEEPVSRALPGW